MEKIEQSLLNNMRKAEWEKAKGCMNAVSSIDVGEPDEKWFKLTEEISKFMSHIESEYIY